MNAFSRTTLAALGLLAVGASGAAAQEYEWTGNNRQYHPPSQAFCRLELNRIFQPNPGQPIHLVITNRSAVRVQYTISIELRRGNEVTSGSIFVDNANPGERSERPSIQAFPGSLAGSRVTLRILNCTQRN